MALLDNGYVDDAVTYTFARARFPNNFIGNMPDNSFRGALYMAGDIINSNDDLFIGKKAPGLSGDKIFPRVPDGTPNYGLAQFPFLDGTTIPQELVRGYEWLGITVALSPEQFGTTAQSSSEQVTTGGGLTGVEYGALKLDYSSAQTDTIKRSATSITPVQLQFHFKQALRYLRHLLRPGAELKLPGSEVDPTGTAVYAAMSQFGVRRA